MNLIVDSGTTKTDWLIVREGTVVDSVCTKGMNPYFQSQEDIRKELRDVLLPGMKAVFAGGVSVGTVYFYGAGCVFDKVEMMREALSSRIPARAIHVYSDLLAAAHSTCGHEAGIACILGTGSNSCFYDGEKIVKNISPLGYVLGDEGGGAMLGRTLVSDVLKEILPRPLREAFFERFRMTQADILEHVYKKPFPNRFLAGFSPFLHEHGNDPEIRRILVNGFNSFFTRNVMQYDYKTHTVNFVGSVAYHYEEILRVTAESAGMRVGKIIRSPLEGLVDYYSGHFASLRNGKD
ncbi:MAG: ATPase [Tannerella sp.]|nr:ATPase [Tannerella sp.]